MHRATSPTRPRCNRSHQSLRIHLQSLPPTQHDDFLQRSTYFQLDTLDRLPLSRRCEDPFCRGDAFYIFEVDNNDNNNDNGNNDDDNDDDDEDDKDDNKDDEEYEEQDDDKDNHNEEDDKADDDDEADDDNNKDQDSLSTVEKLCEGVDFALIIADLELVRSNRRMRSENGSVYSVDSDFCFTTKSEIRAILHHYPDSFLRRYFQNEWPSMHF